MSNPRQHPVALVGAIAPLHPAAGQDEPAKRKWDVSTRSRQVVFSACAPSRPIPSPSRASSATSTPANLLSQQRLAHRQLELTRAIAGCRYEELYYELDSIHATQNVVNDIHRRVFPMRSVLELCVFDLP